MCSFEDASDYIFAKILSSPTSRDITLLFHKKNFHINKNKVVISLSNDPTEHMMSLYY